MPKTNERPMRWMLVGACVAAIAAYVVVVYLPVESHLADMRGELRARASRIEQLGAIEGAIADIQSRLDEATAYRDRWADDAPLARSLGTVYETLDACANRAAVTTRRLDPGEVETLDHLHRIPLQFRCEGEFSDVFRYLAELESLEQSLWIDQLRIAPSQRGEGGVEIEGELVVFAGDSDGSD